MHFFSRHCVLATAVMAGLVATNAHAIVINYDNFNSTAGWQLNGSAAAVPSGGPDAVLRLTPNTANQAGSAFLSDRVTVSGTWSAEFAFNLNSCTSCRGDGFTFVIQNAGATALGPSGGSLGYAGIAPSVAMEFDTFQNAQFNDPNNNHLGLLLSGSPTTVFANDPGVDLYGGDRYVWIDFTQNGSQGEMRVYLNTTDTKPASFVAGFGVAGGWETLFGGSEAYIGFTAGTGAENSNQDILNFTYRNAAIAQVPEPGSLLLVGAGLFALRLRRKAVA